MDDINSIVMFGNTTESAPAPDVKVEAAPAAAATTAAEVEQAPKQERDESGKFKAANTEPAKAQEQAAQQAPEPAKAEKGQMSALLAERAKRQQAEQRAADLERRLQAGNQQPATDFFEDPEKAVQEQVATAVAPFRQAMFQQSLTVAQSQYQDFDEAAEHFAQLVEQNPQLRDNWLASDNPGEFAYVVGSSTPQYRQAFAKRYTDQVAAKDTEIATLKAEIATLKNSQLERVPESLNRQPSGAIPARESNDLDVRNIVRFK